MELPLLDPESMAAYLSSEEAAILIASDNSLCRKGDPCIDSLPAKCQRVTVRLRFRWPSTYELTRAGRRVGTYSSLESACSAYNEQCQPAPES